MADEKALEMLVKELASIEESEGQEVLETTFTLWCG